MESLTLFELNNLVRSVLDATLERSYWLKAELSEVRENSNGNCYLVFVQKDPKSDKLVARANGYIWRSTYALLRRDFEEATGQRLAPGMTVLVEVGVHFHEYAGYSLTVTDIDPTYTLGDQGRKRREILEQLAKEGVADLNRELPWPRPALRIAIVSSPTAAGYGDFCQQLKASPYRFVTRLFPAVMQGERTERSLIAALDEIAAARDDWDAVAVIRGGGAVSDLHGFDTYDLANNVAQFPLPVLSGIGHDRDETVIDLVAYKRLKTPTAVADYLISQADTEAARLRQDEERLHQAARQRMEGEKRRFAQTTHRLSQAFALYASRGQERANRLLHHAVAAATRQWNIHNLQTEKERQRLLRLAREKVTAGMHRLEVMGQTVKAADPVLVLRRGYSITVKDGHVVTSATQLRPGDTITTRLADGTASSIVTQPQKQHST